VNPRTADHRTPQIAEGLPNSRRQPLNVPPRTSESVGHSDQPVEVENQRGMWINPVPITSPVGSRAIGRVRRR